MSNYNLHPSTWPVFTIISNKNKVKHNISLTFLPSAFHTQHRVAATTAQFSWAHTALQLFQPHQHETSPRLYSQCLSQASKCISTQVMAALHSSFFSRREEAPAQIQKSTLITAFSYQLRRANFCRHPKEPVRKSQAQHPLFSFYEIQVTPSCTHLKG